MRTSWKRLPPKGNQLTSWTEAYQVKPTVYTDGEKLTVQCLYEDVTEGVGDTLIEAKNDYLENIRLKIGELTEMLEFCAKNTPCQK